MYLLSQVIFPNHLGNRMVIKSCKMSNFSKGHGDTIKQHKCSILLNDWCAETPRNFAQSQHFMGESHQGLVISSGDLLSLWQASSILLFSIPILCAVSVIFQWGTASAPEHLASPAVFAKEARRFLRNAWTPISTSQGNVCSPRLSVYPSAPAPAEGVTSWQTCPHLHLSSSRQKHIPQLRPQWRCRIHVGASISSPF